MCETDVHHEERESLRGKKRQLSSRFGTDFVLIAATFVKSFVELCVSQCLCKWACVDGVEGGGSRIGGGGSEP